MSAVAQRWLKNSKVREAESTRLHLSKEERRALANVRKEARLHGAVLSHTSGKGGLPHSFALGVFRRHGWKCVVHGDRGEGEYGGLELHHRKHPLPGKGDRIEDVFVVCGKAHEEIHNPPKSGEE